MKNKSCARTVAVFALVLLIAIITCPLWFISPVAPAYAQGYGVDDSYGASGSSGSAHPVYTWLGDKTDHTGTFTRNHTAKSDDDVCKLQVNEGTKALNRLGDGLSGMTIVEEKNPPDPPSNANIINDTTYNLSPDGATFDPPIVFTVKYDPDDIPVGAKEESLTIAWWDKEAGEWVNLPSTVNLEEEDVTAPLSHFSTFTVIVPTRPAEFTASALSIFPTFADVGRNVIISTTVTNIGDLAGSYEVTLKTDDEVTATQTVTLAGGASQGVIFTTAMEAAGS